MNLKHKKYYIYLENLRRSGICNMFGAGEYLEKAFNLNHEKANSILLEWMNNYDEILDELNRVM